MSTPIVLITGALSRLGKVKALAAAHRGAHVVVSDPDEAGHVLADELRALGVDAEFVLTPRPEQDLCAAQAQAMPWSLSQFA